MILQYLVARLESKFWEGGRDLRMSFCHSVVVLLGGGGSNWTCLIFLPSEVVGTKIPSLDCLCISLRTLHTPEVVGTYKCHMTFCECRWSGGSTWRWRGLLSPRCCDRIVWTFCKTKKPSLDCLLRGVKVERMKRHVQRMKRHVQRLVWRVQGVKRAV